MIRLTTEQAQQIEEALEDIVRVFKFETGTPVEALATIRSARAQEQAEPKCNTHPDAPHGFDRNASHSANRYVCECEGWEPEQAEQEPVAWLWVSEHGSERLEWEPVEDTSKWKSTPLYAAPQPVTTPDVCGEVCVRAKLCYGCGKALDEANAKYVEQAEQGPVAYFVDVKAGSSSKPLYEQVFDEYKNDADVFPLYATPIRTKDLTDEEIHKLVKQVRFDGMTDRTFQFARAVIAADREKNRG